MPLQPRHELICCSISQDAFTLIELLVVIAIIAFFAAILFPVFAHAKAAAKGTASVSNTKQTKRTIIVYTIDYHDNFVIGGQRRGQDPNAYQGCSDSQYAPWMEFIEAYLKYRQIS